MAGIEAPAQQCTGFSLLVFDTQELWYYSNVAGKPPERVPAGVTAQPVSPTQRNKFLKNTAVEGWLCDGI